MRKKYKIYISITTLLTLILCSYYFYTAKSDNAFKKGGQILIEYQKLSGQKHYVRNLINRGIIDLHSTPVDYLDIFPIWNEAKENISENKVYWVLNAKKPLLIQLVLGKEETLVNIGDTVNKYIIFVNPGDSICIYDNKTGRQFLGKGSDAVCLQYEIENYIKSLKKPTKNHFRINSLNDYLNWKTYLDNQLEYVLGYIDSNKKKLSPQLYYLIKTKLVYDIEYQRAETFISLYNYYVSNKTSGLLAKDMAIICDSTLNDPWAQWLRTQFDYNGNTWYFYQYNRIQILKRFDFNFSNDSLKTKELKTALSYNSIKQFYKGHLREKILQYVIAKEAIKDLGFKDTLTETILKDYYHQKEFPEFKKWMKNYEDSMRLKYAKL